MTPEAGWHGYWKNPGDSGMKPVVTWTIPRGVVASPLDYPVPSQLLVGGLMNYVYEGPHALLFQLTVPDGFAPGTPLPIKGRLDYLVCTKEVCVPESADLALDLTVGARGADVPARAEFDRFRQALPKPLGTPARFERVGDRIRLAIPLPSTLPPGEPYFYPLTDGVLAYAAKQTFSRANGALIVESDAPSNPGKLDAVEGVLKLGDGNGLSLRAVPGPTSVRTLPTMTQDQEIPDAFTILLALAGAVLGGLLLNIMPCVFPILSLKAIGLAKAFGDESAARRDALAYTAGAVLICLALGAALLGLRAAGVAAGWAFQLQDPRVILVLLLLITAVALNLAGLFELPALTAGTHLAERGGIGGSFWTGALAAFVATPCTGPFMGAALGAALVLPTSLALVIFGGLGLGLALPFLLLAYVAALRRRLPRPGAWMVRFRRVMSVPMFLTALALAWVLGRQAGVDGMALGLVAAMALALSLWWVGQRQGSPPRLAAAGACRACRRPGLGLRSYRRHWPRGRRQSGRAQARAVHRGAPCQPPGGAASCLRILHRRLVRDLQGQ
ncbi:protein-disulfide reductase DsbD domain-containing protein [Sphingomonas sp. J315]|uniref:cytochrome c biogenesis protein CcdA n=1 Tax=Sphingomonas sp. J315 TaxID=2898433 RepID=UPI00289C9BE6|nr:protein-disulfide reductase DsbD domain-containing protein [Sphingomonas sp. J315]